MKTVKKIVIGLGILIFLELVSLSLFSKPTKKTASIPNPTPIQSQQPFYYHKPQTPSLTVSSTTPTDLATHVNVDNTISITFNRGFSQKDVSVSFAPSFTFQAKVIKNTLFITPSSPLLSNLSYYGFVTINNLPSYTFSFTTNQDKLQSSSPDYANDIQTAINQHDFPDVFLSGFTPYTTDTFTVTSDYSSDTPQHFFFIVTLFGDKVQAEQDFITWAIATGLTKEQLATMDIRYN